MSENSSQNHLFFTKKLLEWNEKFNERSMPWKYEKDPYKIWISEIILQQTRVEQGRDYYNRFIKKFPDIKKLAAAKESDVFKLWEGLGYYSRCRNLIASAKYIATKRNGIFPDTYDEILQLKGVGPYTAAAIASFAFQLPYAVTDGNVMRVLARYFSIGTPIDSTAGKKIFSELSQSLLKKDKPGIYNQAIMDLGATVCKPANPSCETCPLSKNCSAFQTDSPENFPVKEKKLVVRKRWFHYVIAEFEGKLYTRSRKGKDIWQQLHEFILIESEKQLSSSQLQQSPAFKKLIKGKFEHVFTSEPVIQKLTHQHIHGVFMMVRLTEPVSDKGYVLKSTSSLQKLAFPKLITGFMNEKKLL